jgi:hypothetical protein
MNDCNDYRRALLGDPSSLTPEMQAHRASCAACAEFSDRLDRFEGRLSRALRLPVVDTPVARAPLPDVSVPAIPAANSPRAGAETVVPLRPRELRDARPAPQSRPRWLALAASVVVALCTAGVLWLAVPRTSLARDVVAHMADEPQAWQVTDSAVAPAKLQAVVAAAHMLLASSGGLVSYANTCEFRGHAVPHLVVQDRSGPVTVMVLVHESVRSPLDFDEGGYRGVIVPVPGHGSIAVLTRSHTLDAAAIDRIAASVRSAIVWTDSDT